MGFGMWTIFKWLRMWTGGGLLWKTEDFLTSWGTTSFSMKTLLDVVICLCLNVCYFHPLPVVLRLQPRMAVTAIKRLAAEPSDSHSNALHKDCFARTQCYVLFLRVADIFNVYTQMKECYTVSKIVGINSSSKGLNHWDVKWKLVKISMFCLMPNSRSERI
jgi:hypothetical protein